MHFSKLWFLAYLAFAGNIILSHSYVLQENIEDYTDPNSCLNSVKSTPKFIDQPLAYKILSELDVFEPVTDSKYLGGAPNAKPLYHKPLLDLKNDDEYCNKHRAYFVENPEMVFEDVSAIMGVTPDTFIMALEGLGKDVMPHIGKGFYETEKNQVLYNVSLAANLFYTVGAMHKHKHAGKHFACLSQQVNHIPGHYNLKMKDLIVESAQNYAKQYKKKPQCFTMDKYFPKTWFLHKKKSCQDFFEKIKSDEYKQLLEEQKVVYIKKIVNSHRGVGVWPLKAKEDGYLRKEYNHGALCGQKKVGMIVQEFIPNPLLLSGHKFDFRMYMLIASTNPLMVYYHDGELRVSLFDYDVNSDDKKVLLTNIFLNEEIYYNATKGRLFNGLDEEGLRVAQQWDFDRLQAHLLAEGVVKDPNWLDNYLRPELKRAMIHLVRMSSHTFLRKSSFYEFYGVDFMLDTEMNLWFLEANAGPSLDGNSKVFEKYIVKMIRDHFEIVMGLLRSRMKRVITLVNEIISTEQAVESANGEVQIRDLSGWREKFKKASMNYFEPEYELSADNSFSIIIDENKSGKERYSGLLDEVCI